MTQLQVFKRTSLKVELLLFVLMICALRTMREEIPILTLVVPRTEAVPIVTIISGLDQDTGIISAQMSWRFIMKCLLEIGQQQKTKETRKTTTVTVIVATVTNQRKTNKQQQ